MIWKVRAGNYTVRGVSLAGIATSLQIPELGVVLDAGIPVRAFAGTDDVFLSHGHGDHASGLAGLLGIRELIHRKHGPRVYVHEAIAPVLAEVLTAMSALHRHALRAELVPMAPSVERQLRSNLWVRAFRTHHPVPSLGYLFFDRVQKLKPPYIGLPGPEIASRRQRGEALFDTTDRLELAYATDTLIRVVETEPAILRSRVLILECSFLDDQKTLAQSRAGGHIHLDELLEIAPRIENEHLVLMHFSQLYSPDDVRAILARRLPPELRERTVIFAPSKNRWPL